MTVLDNFVARRRQIHARYRALLQGVAGVSLLENPSDDFNSNHWLTCIVVNEAEAGFSRETLRLRMDAANIETRPLWKPMHLQPVFAGAPFYGDGTSELLFDSGLCLPSGAGLSDDDVDRVVAVLKEAVRA